MLPPDEIIARIKKALVHGGETHTWDDVRIGIMEGKLQIFWNDHGACVTQVVNAPQMLYLDCLIVAGELPGVMDLSEQVEDFGRSMGCKFMTTSARMGWKKVLPNYGWKESKVVFTKGLN
jgi:hypothetical protein